MLHIQIPTVLGQAMGGGSATTQLALMGALFAIVYFVMIRPQQKQAKEHQAMLGSLRKGDDVVTSGGLLGKIFAVTDKTLVLEVASGVKLRVLKTSIQSKGGVSEDPSKAEEPAKKEEK